MSTKRNHTIYNDLVNISSDYLGPAADRFVRRQIKEHLQKDPEEITPQNLPKLNEWLRISLAFITEDEEILDQYGQRLQALSKKFSIRNNYAKENQRSR